MSSRNQRYENMFKAECAIGDLIENNGVISVSLEAAEVTTESGRFKLDEHEVDDIRKVLCAAARRYSDAERQAGHDLVNAARADRSPERTPTP